MKKSIARNFHSCHFGLRSAVLLLSGKRNHGNGFKRLVLGFAILPILALSVMSQSYAPTSRTPGTPAGSYKLSEFDTVNLFSGNLNFDLPIINVSGRGEAQTTLPLIIENQWGFREHEALGFPQGTYWYEYYTNGASSPLSGAGYVGFDTQFVEDPPPTCISDGYTRWRTYYHHMTFTEKDGTEHVLRDRVLHGKPYRACGAYDNPSLGRIFESTDGSFITFVSDTNVYVRDYGAIMNGYLYFRNGTKSRVDNGSIIWTQDRNGNKLEYIASTNGSTIRDSLGREIRTEYAPNEPAPYGPSYKITYDGFGGEDKVIRLSLGAGSAYMRNTQPGDTTTMLLVSEMFGLSPEQVYGGDRYVYPGGVTAVWLPDGRSYQFRYNVWGYLARVELPTGGAVEYDWADPNVGLGSTRNRVTEKRVYNANNVLVTKTVFSVVQGAPNQIVSVEHFDAAGTRLTKSKHYFYGVPDTGIGSLTAWEVGREFKTETFDSDGTTLLRKREMDWVQRPRPGCTGCSFTNNPFLIETREYLADANLVSKTSSISPATGAWAYDAFNNPTDVWTYDFGTGSAGPLVKHTQMTYVNHFDPLPGLHLLGLPSMTNVYAVNSSGQETLASSSHIIYDEYGSYPILTYGAVTGWQEPATARGNPTTVRQWVNTTDSWIETHAQFDQVGNSRKSWDPLGRMSETVYTDAFTDTQNRNTFAFPTQTISPIPDPGGSHGHGSTTAFVTSSIFDFHSGLTKSTTDINGQTTQLEYNDPLNRLTKIISPNGAWSEHVYNDVIGNLYVRTRAAFDESRVLESYAFYDGLNRNVRTAKLDGEGTWITADTEYDPLGRVWRTSHPYHATGLYGAVNPSGIWTTNQYDALSRPTKVTGADNSEAVTTYFGNTVTSQDPAGKKRKTVSDALGRLTQVIEDPTGLNLATDYKYDILGNLRVVEQGSQRRYYMYDSLSRLVRSKNPEQAANADLNVYDPLTDNDDWANAFEYYANGNMLSKTDARGIRIEYSYDNLNRVYRRHYVTTVTPPAGTYTATPDDEYFYDGKGLVTPPDYPLGKVTKAYSTFSQTRYTQFDQMGRLLSSEQETDGRAYPMSYSYNLSGALVSQTYPSGKEVKNVFDSAGDLWNVAGRNANTSYKTYASNFDYDFSSTGANNRVQLGNGLWETSAFNKRLQTTQVGLGTNQSATNLLKLDYNYGTTNNNSNLQSQTITVPTIGQNSGFTAVQTYSYDQLNRLLTASETSDGGSGWQQTFTYDRFGNRQVNTGATTASLVGDNPVTSTATNRITPQGGEQYQYDPAGNITRDKIGNLLAYNGENQQTAFTPVGSPEPAATYTYDSDGRRVKKVSGNEITIFVYNGLGQMIAEYAVNAPVPSNPTTSYLTGDNLGSARINTDSRGRVQARHDYVPFGEELQSIGGRTSGNGYQADTIRQQFTGYQRDTESGLDYAQARYYRSPAGRFTSVDPLMGSAKVANPQTFNRYSYVFNNPYKYVDPSGMDPGWQGDEYTEQAFGHLGALADAAEARRQAARDAAREEAEKKKKEQEAGNNQQNQQQTSAANNQQGNAPSEIPPPPNLTAICNNCENTEEKEKTLQAILDKLVGTNWPIIYGQTLTVVASVRVPQSEVTQQTDTTGGGVSAGSSGVDVSSSGSSAITSERLKSLATRLEGNEAYLNNSAVAISASSGVVNNGPQFVAGANQKMIDYASKLLGMADQSPPLPGSLPIRRADPSTMKIGPSRFSDEERKNPKWIHRANQIQ